MVDKTTDKTIQDIKNEANKLRTATLFPTDKRGITARLYNFVSKNPTGKFLRNASILGVICAGSIIYGAKHSESINTKTDAVSNSVYSVWHNNTQRLTDLTGKVDYVLSENPQEQDIGKILYSKKEVYISLLGKEPNNKEAQKELQKLDSLIAAYEQIYSSKK